MFGDFTPSFPVAQIAEEEVQLWLIDTNDIHPGQVLEDGLCGLSADEKNRMQQFRLASKQHQFMVGRVALRYILNALMNNSCAHDIKFTTNSFGKPSLVKNSENIQFNLSHSASIILIAVTLGRECGVDIEFVDHTRKIYDLAHYYFHPSEYSTLRGAKHLPADILQFYKLWTLKEAFIKAEGKGMAIPGNQFYFRHTESASPQLVLADPFVASQREWLFHHQFYDEAFSAAVAVAGPLGQPVNICRKRLMFEAGS